MAHIYRGADGILTPQWTWAQGGPNLYAGSSDPKYWWHPDAKHVPVTVSDVPQEQANFETRKLAEYAAQKDVHADYMSVWGPKAHTFTGWTSGRLLVNPYWRGEGDFGLNPTTKQKIGYFKG